MLAAVAAGGGLVTASALRARGIDRQLVAAWARRGRLVRGRRGVYTTSEQWESWDIYSDRPLARVRAVDLTLRVPHVASHDSAALLLDLPLLRPQDAAPHVTRRHLRASLTTGGVHHHGARYDDRRVVFASGIRALDVPRTVVDLAREHGYRAGLVAADGAMQLGVSRADLAAAAAEVAGWPYSLTVDAGVADAGPGAETVIETLAHELVAEAGLGPVETQFPVRIPGGVAWVDLRVGCHLIEAEGRIKVLSLGDGGVADRDPKIVLWDERRRQHLVCAEGVGMTRLTNADFWGGARERAKRRLLAEHAVTERRFGRELPPHLTEFAAQDAWPALQGRRVKRP